MVTITLSAKDNQGFTTGQFYLQLVEMPEAEIAMHLIDDAREYLKKQGIDQWQQEYPNISNIKSDIVHKRGYFVTDSSHIFAYLCIDFEGEPAYAAINGKWISDLPYAVIHRLAVSSEYKGQGFADIAFHLTEKLCLERGIYNIQVDTDENNAIMRHILTKHGFEYCGTVQFESSEKFAYEKLLKQVH